MELSDLRRDFGNFSVGEQSLPENPVDLFNLWLNEAFEKKILEFNAMVLSTVGNGNRPSSRVVLLKEVSTDGKLIFYTNYESRKGSEIKFNPQVSLNFFWKELEKQIRIEGLVKKVSREKSDGYFNSRPVESRISAAISPQSQVIENLDDLRKKSAELIGNSDALQLPDEWGGYEVTPDYFEFWQGGRHRLHHRIRYQNKGANWVIDRLAP